MQSHKLVLIVDDDGDFREALRDALQTEGYETAEASNGAAALDYQRKSPPPGLILLDWNMAPMNGAEFLAELAKEPSTRGVPIVVLTAEQRTRGSRTR
jgi:CheY-like chemotaxis protein